MESIHFNYSLRNVDGLACISKCILYLYLILLTHGALNICSKLVFEQYISITKLVLCTDIRNAQFGCRIHINRCLKMINELDLKLFNLKMKYMHVKCDEVLLSEEY